MANSTVTVRDAIGAPVPCEGTGGRRAATVNTVSSTSSNSMPHGNATDEREPQRPPLVLRGAGVSCRVQSWSFQPHTAQLVLYHQQRLPTRADLAQWTQRLRELGYTKVRTTALATTAALRAESAGFHVVQELVLLEHTSPRRTRASSAGRAPTQRLLPAQHAAASAIDRAAFAGEWALATRAIGDVCAATPHHRARGAGTPLAAYAISGRDAKQGFLQRLAVAPQLQRRGLGRALVLDSLQWLARWRVQRVLVNTPTDNEPALALYEQLGFQRMTERLRVYEQALA